MKTQSGNLWGAFIVIGLLVGAVMWIRNDFGSNVAGAVVAGLAVLLVYKIGQRDANSMMQRTMSFYASIHAAEAATRREEEKTKRQENAQEARVMNRIFSFASAISRAQFGYLKAADNFQKQIEDQQPVEADYWQTEATPVTDTEVQGMF